MKYAVKSKKFQINRDFFQDGETIESKSDSKLLVSMKRAKKDIQKGGFFANQEVLKNEYDFLRMKGRRNPYSQRLKNYGSCKDVRAKSKNKE